MIIKNLVISLTWFLLSIISAQTSLLADEFDAELQSARVMSNEARNSPDRLRIGVLLGLRKGGESYSLRSFIIMDPVNELLLDLAWNSEEGGGPSLRLALSMGFPRTDKLVRLYGGPNISFNTLSAFFSDARAWGIGFGGAGGVEFPLSVTTSMFFEFGGSAILNGTSIANSLSFDFPGSGVYLSGGINFGLF